MNFSRTLAVALVLALAPSFSIARPTLQQRIEAERVKSETLQAKLHQKRRELGAATVRVNDLASQLDATNAAISNVNGRIDDLSAQTHSTQARLSWNTIQLNAARRSLDLYDDLLKKRLIDIYENGDMSYAAVLLSARSFNEFVERWEDLRLLIASNQNAVHARANAERNVARIQENLESAKLQLDRQQQEQLQARNQLGTLAEERHNLLAVANDQRQHVATEVAEIEDLTSAEEAELEALIRERQRELDAQREARRRAAGIAGNPIPNEGAPGALSWPVSGTITSPFGWRSNPFGGAPDFHPGLDIAAPSGTTVTAAASGTVILAQWYGGYGNFILIDHGGSLSSGYGHLSAMYVSSGQEVARGQAIGAVGSTGHSTGPHLHFEVRVNGKPVDPASRLH
ncbi:MAG: peptidoglycan DD-metalloendopeptidase family protein [Candidatus Eremiobacteraeota bacterium]|nr:peptidoglycan DD-metalloendopeptidase family protein [Candidatus Eremiobacteraeota bacterium]